MWTSMGNFIKQRARAVVQSLTRSQCPFALPQAFRQQFVQGLQVPQLPANIGDFRAQQISYVATRPGVAVLEHQQFSNLREGEAQLLGAPDELNSLNVA